MKTVLTGVVAALLILAASCGKKEENGISRVNLDDIKGIWQLTHVSQVVDETSGEGSDASSEEKVLNPKEVEIGQTEFLLASKTWINMMDAVGESEPCELNRLYTESRMEIVLLENNGCYSNILRVHTQSKDSLIISGLKTDTDFGPAKYYRYTFKRIDKVSLRVFFKSQDLFDDSQPRAYQIFLDDQSGADAEAEKRIWNADNTTTDDKKTSTKIDSSKMVFYPSNGNAAFDVTGVLLGAVDGEVGYGFHVYVQDRKIINGRNDSNSVRYDDAHCSFYPNDHDAYAKVQDRAVKSFKATFEEPYSPSDENGGRVQVEFDLDGERMICKSAKGTKTFSVADIEKLGGSVLKLEYQFK